MVEPWPIASKGRLNRKDTALGTAEDRAGQNHNPNVAGNRGSASNSYKRAKSHRCCAWGVLPPHRPPNLLQPFHRHRHRRLEFLRKKLHAQFLQQPAELFHLRVVLA